MDEAASCDLRSFSTIPAASTLPTTLLAMSSLPSRSAKMQAITHLHKPSTQLQSLPLPSFLAPDQPCLCIVKHSSLEFLSLPSVTSPQDAVPSPSDIAPLAPLAHAEFNARILRVSLVGGSSRLAVLTDHHDPRLILLKSEVASGSAGSSSTKMRYTIFAEDSLLLDEMAKPAAELGLGVWTASANDKEVVVAHTHFGNLKILSTSDLSTARKGKSSSARQVYPVK